MIKSDEEYMQIAIEVAHSSTKDGGAAIGALLVDGATGDVLATGESVVGPTHDPTAHAEVNAIRRAAQMRGDDDLHDTILYSTLEPCHMCLSAAAWAHIGRVVFGAYKADIHRDSYFDITGKFSDEEEAARMNIHSREHMIVVGGVARDRCTELLYS